MVGISEEIKRQFKKFEVLKIRAGNGVISIDLIDSKGEIPSLIEYRNQQYEFNYLEELQEKDKERVFRLHYIAVINDDDRKVNMLTLGE